MRKDSTSTRRAFLGGGAILAAPIAAASVPSVALADDRLQMRTERLEAEAAIRDVQQSWLRQVNAGERSALLDGTVRRVFADHAGAPDKIDLAPDCRSAVGRFDYAVEIETPIAADCTLAQMAHAQGNGTLRRTERRKLTMDFTRHGSSWEIARVALTSA